MNGTLVIVRAKEALSMAKNVLILYIKGEESNDRNMHDFKVMNAMHDFKVMNAKWILENTIKRKPKIFQVVKLTAKCFLKHEMPFTHNPDTRIPKRVNMMKMRCADQMFDLGFMPRNKDYKGLLN